MAKKIWYSTPLTWYWNEIYKTQKRITPYLSDEDVFRSIKYNMLNVPLQKNESKLNRMLIAGGLDLWNEDLKGDLLHIFFAEKYLRDYLKDMKISDLESIRDYLYANGKKTEVEYTWSSELENESCVYYSIGLHVPYEKEALSFNVILYENSTIEIFFNSGQNSGIITNIHYQDSLLKEDEKSKKLCEIFRLAINTITYMKCFPESVKEGVPKITKGKEEIRSNNNVIIKPSLKILGDESTPNAKIPHFRRGYFKVLKSPKFKNKRGQVIYVSETMVRGKAKTLYTSDTLKENEIPSK
ncbi:hypothetical protein [Flammeovirga pacifica]|uniref:Uncharacterized protein n=1 Tax=Flammeovirga pacifica TaxID=915059 RepID=A0A1S1YVP9_FLAPC|nr:hypothetical protein [Flammeovirga pacifica]OHX65108.1 hypothetical protein NH26_01440 [Flammeovirga pacifica]